VPTAKFLTEVEGVVLELLLEKIFSVPRSGLAAVDAASKFYVLWRFQYKHAEIDAGEAIVFAYPQGVELDGARGLTAGPRALVEKKKSKMKLKDYAERGEYEKLGLPNDDGTPAPLIDVLHRSLWLMENQPGKLNEFLDAARPDLERLRLVAQALAGPALQKKDGELGATPTPEQSALGKLTSNWRSLIEENLFRSR
jgi:putative DNA methylase